MLDDISFAQWLANAEDDARAEAEETARRAALAREAAVVEAGAGDTDPVVAAQNALRTFPPDELVVVLPDREEGATPPGSSARPCPAWAGWGCRCDTCGRAARGREVGV